MKKIKEKVLKETVMGVKKEMGGIIESEGWIVGYTIGKTLAEVGKVIDELEIKQTDDYRILKELKQKLGIK